MLLVSSLLMVVANNVPVLASFRWLWGPVTLAIALVSFKNSINNRQVITVLIYGLLYCGVLQYSLWQHANDWYKNSILQDFYAMIVVVVFYSILYKNRYYKEWANLAKIGLVFFIITGIMTIVATQINPMIVRDSYNTSIRAFVKDLSFLEKFGFGSYGYMTALVALFPVLVFFIKKKNKVWLSKRGWIVLTIFFYFVLIRAQIFANILVVSMMLLIAFSGARKFKRSLFISFMVGVILISIPDSFWIDLLKGSSDYFNPNSEMNYKLNDMANFISNPNIYDPTTGAGSRAERYPLLLQAFSAQPITGDASYNSPFDYGMAVGGHLYWMSRLALWGVFGFMGYLIILSNIFKPVLKIFDKEFKFYYFLSLLSIIVLGMLKALGGREPYIMLLIIIPGLYFLQSASQKSK